MKDEATIRAEWHELREMQQARAGINCARTGELATAQKTFAWLFSDVPLRPIDCISITPCDCEACKNEI
jgi:hypothetical protein